MQSAAAQFHEPLSQRLGRLLEQEAAELTANRILARTEGRGLYLVIVLLSLPFVAWISVPGVSVVLGLMIAMLALRLALGKPPRLPKVLGDRALKPRVREVILSGGLRFCRLLERVVRPRRTAWMSWRIACLTNALLIFTNALLLALPLPTPPFFGSNALPSYAIILLAVSMMEADGVMIWFGYLATATSLAYFLLFGTLVAKHLGGLLHTISHWLGWSS